jgi:hypothetical protein
MREGQAVVDRHIAIWNESDRAKRRELIGQSWTEEEHYLRVGAICVIAGSLAVFAFRLAHGDPPAATPEAHLQFVTDHPAYAGVHLGTILGVLVWVGGIIVLVGTFMDSLARLLGRWGTASVLIGAAIFGVDFTIDGVAGQDLARAWAAATPAGQADLVRAAHTATTMLRGPSLMAIVILWGLPLLLFGRAMMLEGYPTWLGWTGLVVGAVTILGATALLLQPELFPGVVVYGLLASVLVQMWSLVLGLVMWHRASTGVAERGRGAVLRFRDHVVRQDPRGSS